jgi:hypothetical protein
MVTEYTSEMIEIVFGTAFFIAVIMASLPITMKWSSV